MNNISERQREIYSSHQFVYVCGDDTQTSDTPVAVGHPESECVEPEKVNDRECVAHTETTVINS